MLRCHRSSTAQLLRPSFPRPRGRACLWLDIRFFNLRLLQP
jgi:hypothetical protein